jgi:hypothetical protein
LSGTGYWIQAQQFQQVYADMKTGNKDVANLYDSNGTGTDTFFGSLHDAVLTVGSHGRSRGTGVKTLFSPRPATIVASAADAAENSSDAPSRFTGGFVGHALGLSATLHGVG